MTGTPIDSGEPLFPRCLEYFNRISRGEPGLTLYQGVSRRVLGGWEDSKAGGR
jgi:hypothetical protein